MGILPSRESHEYPGAFHFAQSGSHAMAILPLTEHFFPSVDSLAFKQLYAGREMQSAKYNFSLMSPELLRRYRHRAMEQRHVKEEVGEEATAPPAGRRKSQPYLRHGQPPGDGSDTSEKWVGVDTIDASNYSQFFRDDTQCVSPNSPALPFLDGDEEVCEELQRPNPAAHWHTHDATKQLIQDEDSRLGFAEELHCVSLDGKGSGPRCPPSSLSLSCSSSQHLRLGQPRNNFTRAAASAETETAALTTPLTAEERDVLNRFFARSPEALYNALVVEPNKGFLVDTNKEMCKLYAAERRWKEARNVVRAYRRQCKQDAASGEAARSASGRSHESPRDPPQSRVTKEEADEAAKVPPPPVFLRPVPQVIMVRMSREEEEAARAAYLEEQQRRRDRTAPPQQSRSGDGDSITPSTSSSVAAAGADEGTGVLRSPTPSSLSPLHVPTSRYHRFEDDPKYKDGRIHLVEEDGVLYMFAYNTAYVDPRERVRQQREELLKQQQQQQRQQNPLTPHEGNRGSSGSSEACRSPLSAPATVTGTIAEATAREPTAGSPGCPTTERRAAATFQTDGSDDDDDDGALCHTSRQTSSFYHIVSSFSTEEVEADREEKRNQSKKVSDASRTRAGAATVSPVTAAAVPAVAATQAESIEDDNDNSDGEEEGTTISSASHGSRGRQRQPNTATLADDDASLQRSDEKPSTSSDDDDDDEDDGDVRCKDASDSAPSAGTNAAAVSGTASAATKEKRSRVVQQLELVTAAPFILPICPVRVVGCNGYAESRCRGTPWLRGYEDEPEEDAYVESLPVKPPIMSGGGFIDANIGDKILSRAYLLGFQVYRNVCLDAGLPETLTRPFWTLGLLSNIPLLQIYREMRFRMRAAAAEVELGYGGLRDMIKGTENDLQSYIYGFSDILPYLERASRGRIEEAEAEAKAAVAAAAEGGNGGGASEDAAASQNSPSLPAEPGSSEKVEEAGHQLPNRPVLLAIPTRSSQSVVQHNLLFPPSEMEFYTQFTIRGNQSLSRVRCEAQESFFHLIAEATAPVSTSLFMKPLELSMYDYGGAIRLHLMCDRVTGADELQVLPPPRNLDQLLSDHQRRLQLRRQPRALADGKEKPKPNVKGGKEETAGGEAAPPYLVYAVVHPSSKAPGPSLEHHRRNLQAPGDGSDAYTLDQAEAAAAATGDVGEYAAHQYTYPPGSFVDSDMVIYNLHKGRWEHFEYFHQQQLAQRRARKLQVQVEKAAGEPEDNKEAAESRSDTADTAASKRAAEGGEACQGGLVTSGGGDFTVDGEDVQDIHLEDILLCWIKRRLQSATMRNRSDPGWLRDSEGHIVQEGRYYIWGFEQDSQQYFYGLIPKFAKEKKNKRHNTSGSNAQNQQQHDNRIGRSSAHGTLSGPSSALSTHQRSKVASSSSGAGTTSAYRSSPSRCIANAPEHGDLTGDGAGGNGSARDRNATSPGTRSPASERSLKSSVINGQAADRRGSDKIERAEVRSVPAAARESAENCRASEPTATAATPSVSSDLAACGSSGLDTRTDAPLSVAYPNSLSKRQQQQQHTQSPGAVSRGGGTGVASSGGGSASANRSSNPRNSNSGARQPAQTSGAPRSGTSRKSPPPTSSSTSSPVTTSAAAAAVSYNTPGVSGLCAAGSRGPTSPSPSPSATSGAHRESEGTRGGRPDAAAEVCGSPSHANSAPAQSLPSSAAVGGVATDTSASFESPHTLPYPHDGVGHTNGTSTTSHEQQWSTSASTEAQLKPQSPAAPTDSIGYCQGHGDKRGKATASSYASSHSQKRQQQGKPRSANASPPPPQPPVARSYPPHMQQPHPEVHSARHSSSAGSSLASVNPVPQQQHQHGRHITDFGAAVLGCKGAPQSRYHGPQRQQMEYMQPPPTATGDHSSSNNSNHGGNSGACNYPAASQASGQGYSDTSLPPHPSSPPPPVFPSGVESAAYEQSHQGYPTPAQQQLPPDSSLPPHLHPPTVYMNTGAAQANLRPSSTPTGPRVPSPRHAQQRQQYATYTARLQQQQHMPHQSYYNAQLGIASAVTGAVVQQSEMAPGTYYHHGQQQHQQQQMLTISAPNASPTIMNTCSSRHAPHPRLLVSGSVMTPMQQQQQQQQLAPLSAVSVAPLSALAGGNSMYSDVSATPLAPSGSRAMSYHLTSPSQVSYGTSSQATKAAMQPAGLQSNAPPPHTGLFSPAALPPQQPQQAYPSPALMDGSTAGRQGGAASHGCPQTQPLSPLRGTASTAPAGSRCGQMASPTSQQYAHQQQMGPRNVNYNGGSSSHNHGAYAVSAANNNIIGSSSVATSLPKNSNPNVHSSYGRVGSSLPATAKAMAGGSGTSLLMSNAPTALMSASSGIGRGAQGYTPQHSGYPTSASASLTPTPVATMDEGATVPTSSMMPGSEGSAVSAYPPYRTSQHSQQQQSQPSPQQQPEASVGGRPAGAPSPSPHLFCITSATRKQQRDSGYSLQAMAHSCSNDFGNGGAPAMRSGGRASRGMAATSDGVDSIGYDDAMMHGGPGAHATGGEFQLPYPPQQQYQQSYPQWQQQQHPNSASSQPSSSSPTPLPVQQYAAHAGNGNHDGSRGHTHTQASYAAATGNMNTSSAYAHEPETEPCPQHAAVAAPTSPAAISSGSAQSAAAAVTVSATVAHGSSSIQRVNSYNGTIAAMKPAGSSASTQASSAATQQQRNSDSQGYRPSRPGPTSPYSQTSQQHQKEPQRHPRQQRLTTRTTAAGDPFHRDAGSGIQQKAMVSAGGDRAASASHAYPLPQKQQQQCNMQSTPSLGGYYQALAQQQQQQPSVASQPLAPTPNASGTLLRVSPGLQQRYSRQSQRQQQQRKSSPSYTSSKGAAERQTQMIGGYSSQKAHNSNVGAAEGPCDVNSSAATQRFAHNPYAMQ
ncbi:hypothetical protein GH5_07565 [Leishmania sp. Ghana 2012 LV757]|uniref:hypothetical protein n=1 Tax=Leishmania sp. Ghana 2012 LV757 TaxID=2803181 RepID=UPI001B731B5A|nr:hypothetical protein GH5_07565 [Leishmania sp. Ghana 2012 LV757]